MGIAVQGELEMEPRLNLTVMAEIVRDLLAGGVSRLQDGVWLRERAETVGLDAQEGAALEALRVRLASGRALLDTALTSPWGVAGSAHRP
jgi:hypothetical protein